MYVDLCLFFSSRKTASVLVVLQEGVQNRKPPAGGAATAPNQPQVPGYHTSYGLCKGILHCQGGPKLQQGKCFLDPFLTQPV